jgi:signal transduction histidine kinase
MADLDGQRVQAADDAAGILRRRLRIALVLSIGPLLLFAAVDQYLHRSHLPVLHALKLGAVAVVLTALYVLRRPRRRRDLIAVALVGTVVMCALTATSAIITAEVLTTPLISISVVLGAAILLPWGVIPQGVLVVLAAATTVVTVRCVSGGYQALISYPNVGVAIGLGLSVYVAYELERRRLELVRYHRRQRRAEAELWQLNQELEGRVLDRTARLQRLNEELEAQVLVRTRAEAKERRSEAALAALIDNVSDAMWSVDRALCVTAFNSACRERLVRLLGAPLDAPLVHAAHVAVPWPEWWRTHFAQALAGEHFCVEHEVAEGAVTACYLTSFNPIVADGAVTGVAVFNMDVSERKRGEEEARRHQAELTHVLRLGTMGEMAAGLAHEINQPLGAIANYAQGCSRRLRAGTLGATEALGVVDEISEEALRAGEIIRRLRNLIRKETPRQDRVDLNDVVRDAVHLVTPEARQHGVTVQVRTSSTLPRVVADGIQIEQVVLNLARNGIEAMTNVPATRRRLSIGTKHTAAGEVEVTVKDSGHGLPPDGAAQVFAPFYTTKASGLGMGLSISRTIIEAHHGRLWATANPEGGTTFRFTLPVGDDAKQRDAEATPRSASAR